MTVQRQVKISVTTNEPELDTEFTIVLPVMLTARETKKLLAVREDRTRFELDEAASRVMEFLDAAGVVERLGKPPTQRYLLSIPPSVRARMFTDVPSVGNDNEA